MFLCMTAWVSSLVFFFFDKQLFYLIPKRCTLKITFSVGSIIDLASIFDCARKCNFYWCFVCGCDEFMLYRWKETEWNDIMWAGGGIVVNMRHNLYLLHFSTCNSMCIWQILTNPHFLIVRSSKTNILLFLVSNE